MVAILDQTKILLDVHQGPVIGHNCAQYEWDLIIHVWERASEWFPYVKYMENVIGHLAAILDQNFKMRLCASMGHYRQCSWMTMSRSHYILLRSDPRKVHPDKVQNRPYGGHIGSDQNFTGRASRPYHRSWLCPIWKRSIDSCLRSGRGQKKSNDDGRTTTDDGRTHYRWL